MTSRHWTSDADTERVTQILEDLIRADSVNPALPGGRQGEREVAAYIDRFCSRLGMAVTQREVLPGRPNVLARLGAAAAGPTLLIEAHTDTVTTANMPDGLQPRREGGRLYGRGACDTKGGLAAALHALELLAAAPELPRAAVHLLGAIDEEVAYRGVLDYLDQGGTADAAVVIEPTGLAPVVATKGCVRVRIRTVGRSAHTSRPALGVNAVRAMTTVMQALEHWVSAREESHPLCGDPTLTVARIEGGTQINIVPDACLIDVDYRTLPQEQPDQVLAQLADLLAHVSDGQEWSASVEEVLLTDLGLDTPTDSAVARAAATSCRRLGLPDTLVGVPYGSDASKLAGIGGIPSLVLGPGDIAQAHASDEWVEVEQLRMAADLYASCAVELARAAR